MANEKRTVNGGKKKIVVCGHWNALTPTLIYDQCNNTGSVTSVVMRLEVAYNLLLNS